MATRNSISKFDASSFRRDSVTGDLHAKVNPTRAGVFVYRNPDGTLRRELRPRDEVFKADSMPILNWKPLTNDHPSDGKKHVLLDERNADKYRRGIVFDHKPAADGLHTEAQLIVTDKAQIALIEGGKLAVSCGYNCREDWTSGNDPEFGPYDMIQRDIQYNHLANVYRGRAGEGATIRMDASNARFDAEEVDPEEMGEMGMESSGSESGESQEAPNPRTKEYDSHLAHEMSEKVQCLVELALDALVKAKSEDLKRFAQSIINNQPKDLKYLQKFILNPKQQKNTDILKESPMASLKLDHGDFEIENDLDIALKVKFAADQKAINDEKLRADAAEQSLTEEKARAERLDAELLANKQELKAYNEAKARDARKALEAKAQPILGDGQKFDGLSDREVKEMTIEKSLPWAKDDKALSERTDEWIDTMLAVAVRQEAPGPVSPTPGMAAVIAKATAKPANGERVDADPNDPKAAYQEMMNDILNAHKVGAN